MDIREAIKLARGITDFPGVVVPRHELIVNVGDRVNVAEEKVLSGLQDCMADGLKAVALQPIKQFVEKKIGRSVKIHEVHVSEDVPFYGYVEDGENGCSIVKIKAGMNLCWQRFTILKELMHLYSNTCTDAPNVSASLLVKAARASRFVIARDDSVLDDETAAFYIALEVAVPWCLREQFLKLRDLGATHYQIAKAFMAPVPFVSHIIEDDDIHPYAALSHRINQNI